MPAWLKCGSKSGGALRWSRASRTPPGSCSQWSMKRGLRGALALRDARSPPGTLQTVSRGAEEWGEMQPPPGLVTCLCPVSVAQIFQQPGWGGCSRRPPATPAEHLLGGPKSPWVAKIPPRWPQSPQDGHNPLGFFRVGRSVVFAHCGSGWLRRKAEQRPRTRWL